MKKMTKYVTMPVMLLVLSVMEMQASIHPQEVKSAKQVAGELKECLKGCEHKITTAASKNSDSHDGILAEVHAKNCVRECARNAESDLRAYPENKTFEKIVYSN